MKAIRKWGLLFVLLNTGLIDSGRASEFIEILPITDRIVALHFDDGRVVRRVAGQPFSADRVISAPLTVSALSPSAFTISSTGAAAFQAPLQPLTLKRKSKGTEFALTMDNWLENGPRGAGSYPTTPYHAAEHWIYLTLPAPLQAGQTYSFSWSGTALNTKQTQATLVFNPASIRSEAIHVNTLGYVPTAPQKFGYLYHWAGDLGSMDYAAWEGAPFRLVDADSGQTVFTGKVAFRKPLGNAETAHGTDLIKAAVWECDFSAFQTPGNYRLVVDRIGCSYPFTIAPDIYTIPFRAVMQGIYQQRSGIALVTPFADEPRPAPHNPQLTPGFANRLFYSSYRGCDMEAVDAGTAADKLAIEAAKKGNLTQTWGWYQDAGDWDGYLAHTDLPIALLSLYLIAPQKFFDGQLLLPEMGNGVPDILDEAAWLPRYYYRLRHELLAKGWGTGGVGSRVFGDQWGPDQPGDISRGSWQDTDRDWYVTGEDPFSTFRYATIAALLAEAQQLAKVADPAGINWANEAVAAYAWAIANTRPGDPNIAGKFDGTLADHRATAAVALYRLTGEQSYHDQFLTDSVPMVNAEQNGLRGYAVNLYLTANRTLDVSRSEALRSYDSSRGVSLLSAGNRAMRWGGNWWQPVQIGAATTPLIQPLIWGHNVFKTINPSYADNLRTTLYNTCDYFLGNNPLHTTWITGLGPRAPKGLFHIDDWALGPIPRRGLIPYGPNAYGTLWINKPLRIPFSPVWAYDSAYPEMDSNTADPVPTSPGTWPVHESWFDQALDPQTSEFTFYQTNLNAAVTFGYLLADSPTMTSWTAKRLSSLSR